MLKPLLFKKKLNNFKEMFTASTLTERLTIMFKTLTKIQNVSAVSNL